MLLYYFIGIDQGAVSVFGNDIHVHEFVHDARHFRLPLPLTKSKTGKQVSTMEKRIIFRGVLVGALGGY